MKLQIANRTQINQIFSLYKSVVEAVLKTSVKLGWNTEIYPSLEWIKETVSKNEMLIFSECENIIGVCCVNHNEVLSWCRKNGDAANHLDVIDTNLINLFIRAFDFYLLSK